MNNCAVTACERLSEFGTVDCINDSLTYFCHACGTEVATEAELTVACAVIVSLCVLFGVLVNELESSLCLVAAGDLRDDVNLTLLEHIHLCFVNELDICDCFD